MRKFGSCGIILIAAAVCATAVACTPDDGNVEYTPKRNATLTGNFYVSKSPYEETERVDSVCYNEEHAYYVFQSDIAPKTRDDVMDTAEEILEKFGYSDIKFHTFTNCITGYVDGQLVGEGYYGGMDSGMFLCLDDFSPLYITLACNQKKYGADVNYGLLYALSYGQCADWGYDLPECPSVEEIVIPIAQTPEISTLNTAVFQTYLAYTADMKRAAEGLAIKLYEKLGVEGLEKLALSDNADAATRIYANGLCYSLGVEPLVYDPLSGYKTYQTAWYVVAESAEVRVFMSKVYYDCSYLYFYNLRDYFSLLQAIPRQAAELKEYMGVTLCPRLEILYDGSFFTGPEWEGASIAGMTFVSWVQCASVFCTVHELTHLLTWYKTDGAYVNESSLNVWTAEAFPTYMAAMFDENFFAAENYVWVNDEDSKIEDVTSLMREMLASHPVTNKIEYFDLYAYCLEETGYGSFGGWGWADNLKLRFATAVSLVNYLIETYGKDKFMDLYYTHGATEESVYGKDFDILYGEWFESIKARFES